MTENVGEPTAAKNWLTGNRMGPCRFGDSASVDGCALMIGLSWRAQSYRPKNMEVFLTNLRFHSMGSY